MDQSNNVKVKRSAKGTRLVVVTAVILAVLILLNVGISLLPRAWSNFVADSSDAFSISAKSKSFFKNLDTDVTIYYVFDPDMTYDSETCYFTPQNRYDYQEELRSFKELNHWNEPIA